MSHTKESMPELDRQQWENPTSATTIPPSIAKALVIAQKASHSVEKARTMQGPNFSYKFAGAEAVIEEARRALGEAGLGVLVGGWDCQNGRLSTRFLIVHESGASWLSQPVSFPAVPGSGRPPDKAEASALTYVTNYFLCRLLNLARVEEDISARDDSTYAPSPEANRPAANRPPSGGHIMRFGRHKGREFTEVLASDYDDAVSYRTFIAKSINDANRSQYREANIRTLSFLDELITGYQQTQSGGSAVTEEPWNDGDMDEIPF